MYGNYALTKNILVKTTSMPFKKHNYGQESYTRYILHHQTMSSDELTPSPTSDPGLTTSSLELNTNILVYKNVIKQLSCKYKGLLLQPSCKLSFVKNDKVIIKE